MSNAAHLAHVEASKNLILQKLRGRKPALAIILGSGLGGLGDKITDAEQISYKDLPGFPLPGVAGHEGSLIIGTLGGKTIIALKGRKHFYETHDAYPLKTMIRAVKAAGAEILFISNAAASLRPDIPPGGLMAIADHINFMDINPLTGPNDDEFGPRFPAMTDAWDPALRQLLKEAAARNGAPLAEGVYLAFRGPNFETPAEIRMAKLLGADAVGMSSVPDCIIARHCGMRVVGCSCTTNMGAGLSDEQLSHAHTLENAGSAAARFEALVTTFIAAL